MIQEDLRKWFKEKWVRMDTKGNIKGQCAREPGEGKPKCLPLAKAQAMSQEKRARITKRKRREDPVADRAGKGEPPVFTSNEEFLYEENKPTKPKLWSKAKALAKKKFDVYPSAYANLWASKWYKAHGGGWRSVNEDYGAGFEGTPALVKKYKKGTPGQVVKEAKSPAWQRKEGKDPKGGLNKKGVKSYRRENPGSKLQTAVTKDPKKIKKGSKDDKRRKSFCRRMKGMKAKLTSAETARDPDSRINKALRKWNC